MASKGQMTGMLGVYLVAAELTDRGFIVSPTSRSAMGADLLVTDQSCQKAWSVQVKTNRKAAKFWLLSKHAKTLKSDTHAYVFVNVKGKERPDFLVVSSHEVADRMHRVVRSTGSTWYSLRLRDMPSKSEGWELFGDAGG